MKGRLSYGKIKEIHHKWKMNGNSYVNKLKKKMLPALKPEHLAFLKEISEDPRNTVLSGRERKLLLQIHFGIKNKNRCCQNFDERLRILYEKNQNPYPRS